VIGREAGLAVSLDVSAVPLRLGGVGYYTQAIATGLAERDDVMLTMVCRRDDEARWAGLTGPTAALRDVVPSARPARLVFEQTGFPTLLRGLGVAVHHGPHYTMPTRSPVPCAVTIHDCTFFDHPEWHMRSKAVFFRRAIRRAARQAGVLICVSQATAERLVASCDVRAPIAVVPHGVDHVRFTATEPSGGADAALLGQAGIPTDRPLVVFVGTLEPRKGVASLVAAFDRVAEQQPDAVLVLAGQMGWGLAETERALAAARHLDRIIQTGYLSDVAVPALLRQAAVVAYPSLDEGFGLPALEALACGAPLVTTEGTAMAEVAGPAARLVPPGDTASLAHALESALGESPRSAAAQQRRALGRSQAALYTWEASVQQHVVAYELARVGSQ
jgi:glycosyltransferase involved in cell wall biosynthesis